MLHVLKAESTAGYNMHIVKRSANTLAIIINDFIKQEVNQKYISIFAIIFLY